MPVRKHNRYLMDGGVVSNLPVEPALRMGAGRVVALDLMDIRETPELGGGLPRFVEKLSLAAEKRESDLELELAKARGIPTLYVNLVSSIPVPIWDFAHTGELIDQGYEITRRVLEEQAETKSQLISPE